jgi:hypothetical protein
MSDRGDPTKAGSRIIRERAMAILRDTRSRIDPALLAVMKEKLSAVMPPSGPPQSAAPQPPILPAAPLKEGLFKRNYQQPDVAATKSVPKPALPPETQPAADLSGTEPVDRQKIAQIVLEYMKNREEKQKH